MADNIDPRVIKKTQDLLGKVIKKPPLNEKLLRKPPFRFLHDIITNVIKTTKFFEGLYNAEELQSENIKDKEKKTAFLQKAIDVIIMVTGENLTIKPTKVVSGHEPQKTNEFLQAIGKAILEKKDSTEAVQKVLSGEKPPSLPTGRKKASDVPDRGKRRESISKDGKPNADKAPSRSHEQKSRGHDRKPPGDQNKIRDRNKTKERGNSKDRLRLKARDQTPEQNNISSPPKAKLSEKDDETTKENTSKIKGENVPASMDGDKENNSVSRSPARILTSNESKEEKDATLDLQNSPSHNSKSPPQSATRPVSAVRVPSAKPKAALPAAKTPEPEPLVEPEPQPSSSRPVRSALKSARPSSARPAPPKIRIRHIVENEEQIRLPSAKPVANVILDTKENSDNEDDTFITEEPPEPSVIDNPPVTSTPSNAEEEPQGSLVKQLLETKKDLEGGSQQMPSKKVEIDKSVMNDVARKRERESVGKELEHLRSFIQTVSRSANPLGKILDYLQEDIDSMQQELKMWQDEHQQNLLSLSREESVTENALDPLRAQLEELDQAVQDQSDSISTLKASILRNDERIHRMLAAVNHPVPS